MIPNRVTKMICPFLVVNCFQNCIFTYDSQQILYSASTLVRCELLSELYFYLWFPTSSHLNGGHYLLWIAFRIVFLLMIPNRSAFLDNCFPVVNCFQNCIFTYDSQRLLTLFQRYSRCELLSELYFYLWFPTALNVATFGKSCELLSELYFYLWFPTSTLKIDVNATLWIAFRIVFLLMIPNNQRNTRTGWAVVNCFQNCIFTYDSQPSKNRSGAYLRCELLSELYFYLWFPTLEIFIGMVLELWIAFRIVFLLMIPNLIIILRSANIVVNCFQNCIFTYDSQLLKLRGF